MAWEAREKGKQWYYQESSPSSKVVDSYMGLPTVGLLPPNLTDIKLLLPLHSARNFFHFTPHPGFLLIQQPFLTQAVDHNQDLVGK